VSELITDPTGPRRIYGSDWWWRVSTDANLVLSNQLTGRETVVPLAQVPWLLEQVKYFAKRGRLEDAGQPQQPS